MNSRQWKWTALAAAGSTSGIAMLLVFQSVPVAAETATAVIVAMIVLKHLALAVIVGSPLAAILQKIRPKIRQHCPFASS